MIDLTSLFDERPSLPYGSEEDELRAVADGTKAMCYLGFRDDVSVELAELVAELGLELRYESVDWALEPESRLAFVLRPDSNEHWRVPALLLLKSVAYQQGPWTRLAQELESRLLGYSDEQVAAYMRRERETWPVYGVGLLYMLIPDAELAKLEPLARRCFSPGSDLSSFELFRTIERVPVKANALELLPASVSLARVSLSWDYYLEKLFEPSEEAEIEIANFDGDIAALNRALRSSIEIFGPNRWGAR